MSSDDGVYVDADFPARYQRMKNERDSAYDVLRSLQQHAIDPRNSDEWLGNVLRARLGTPPPDAVCSQCEHTYFHHVFGACDVSRGGERVDDCPSFGLAQPLLDSITKGEAT